MLVIMKALLSGYNIGLSTIHEAWNAKVLCLFAKAAYLDLFIFCTILYNMHFFSITVNRPWRPPDPPAVSWCPIWSTSSSKDSYWSPLATAEGLGPRFEGGDIQKSIPLR